MAAKKVKKVNKLVSKTKGKIVKEVDENKYLKYLFVIFILIFTLFWVIKKDQDNKKSLQQPITIPEYSYNKINNSEDLNRAGLDLDNTDLNSVDKELQKFDADSNF